MNAWMWVGIVLVILFAGYGMYVWGFMNGCDHASKEITENILTWEEKMTEKYCGEEAP